MIRFFSPGLSLGKPGIQVKGVIQVGYCLLVVFEIIVNSALIEVGRGTIELEFDSQIQIFNSMLVVVQHAISSTPNAICKAILEIEVESVTTVSYYSLVVLGIS